MALKDDLWSEVDKTFRSSWSVRDGRVVPSSDDIALGNDAVHLEKATVLYADMADSTALVDSSSWQLAAEIYKSFLFCAAKIINSEGGEITAYDGDRIMAIFLGNAKNTTAVRTALKINFARVKVINPLIAQDYPKTNFQLTHVVGIDSSEIHAARTGVRGANDLVWVGRAANYAAKLSALPATHATWITGDIFDNMHDSVKMTNGNPMWEEMSWTAMRKMRIHRSTWYWPIS